MENESRNEVVTYLKQIEANNLIEIYEHIADKQVIPVSIVLIFAKEYFVSHKQTNNTFIFLRVRWNRIDSRYC